MYLSTDFITELLTRHNLTHHLDAVHVSSDHLASKSRGDLYRRIQISERVRAREWRHVGDNAKSDVVVPRLLGIGAEHASAASLNRFERLWEDHRYESGGFTSLIAGASRMARLSTETDEQLQPIRTVAAGVAGPILTAYVLWVLHSAIREDVRRLYFLARDGEILYLVACRLVKRLGLDLELKYLYGSRSVFHRASLASRPVNTARWAWSAMYRSSPIEILSRLGIEEDDARDALSRLGIEPDARPTSENLIKQLVRDDEIVRQARMSGQQLLQRVQGYLRQEGFCDGVRSAIVDTGWAGRIVESLANVLPDDAAPLARCYLFGYMKRANGYASPEVLRGYLFDEYAETGFAGHFNDAYGPLETFTVADHGMTTDFREREGRFEPVLASDHNPILVDWPWAEFRETVFRFVDELVLDSDIANVRADLRTPVAAALTAFWSNPTEEESRAWGAYIYEDDILASSHNSLASEITLGDFLGKARPSYEGRRVWLQGSVMLSHPMLRPAARAGLWLNERRRSSPGLTSLMPAQLRQRARLLAIAARSRTQR
jgi:hypothetical protein